MSNCLDPDQDRLGPDLFSNCLQKLSADDKSPPARKKLVSVMDYYGMNDQDE